MRDEIVADEKHPQRDGGVQFAGRGDAGARRWPEPEQVADADASPARSVTRVDEKPLAGSWVRFLGSATIGFDHVHMDYLAARGIGFADGAGQQCDLGRRYVAQRAAGAVATAGCCTGGQDRWCHWSRNVGSRVRARLRALGMERLVNDLRLQALGAKDDLVSLDDVLACDIVTARYH